MDHSRKFPISLAPVRCEIMSSPDYSKPWSIIWRGVPYSPNSHNMIYLNGNPPIEQPFGVYESKVGIIRVMGLWIPSDWCVVCVKSDTGTWFSLTVVVPLPSGVLLKSSNSSNL